MPDTRQEKLKKLEGHLQSIKSLYRDLNISPEGKEENQQLLEENKQLKLENEKIKSHVIFIEDMILSLWVKPYTQANTQDTNELSQIENLWGKIVARSHKEQICIYACQVQRLASRQNREITCIELGQFTCPQCGTQHLCKKHINNHFCREEKKITQ